MKFTVLTLFPNLFPGILGESLLGTALEQGKWQLEVRDIRDVAEDLHKTVDDTPYGGGAGMVMKPDILAKAIDSVQPAPEKWVYVSPRGKVWNQARSRELMQHAHVGLICGRYEGIDQRVLNHYGIEEISLGDFVLSGGEIAAYAIIDTCVRKIFGVLGNALATDEESFGEGEYEHLLEYPHYTRPAVWRDMEVPEVLRSGDHRKVREWRLTEAEALTKSRRPDVWTAYCNKQAREET